MVPCALCDMQFKVALPEQDEIQLTVIGMALGLGEPLNANKYKRKIVCRSQSKDQVKKSGTTWSNSSSQILTFLFQIIITIHIYTYKILLLFIV